MQRTLFVGETAQISLLGPPVEPLIERGYIDYFGGREFPWEEIDGAATAFFDAHPNDPAAHDAYFNNFISLWRHLLGAGNFVRAEFTWERVLQPALAWEQAHPGQYLHKGTPLYFWAMTTIIRRDMDRGYLLAHRALEEDIRTHGQARPNTPGYALVSLDHERPDQAFRTWVQHQATYVEQRLNGYNATHTRTLTIQDLKARFLDNPPSLDVLFLFTYTLARLINITDEPAHVRTNAFAGQLELNVCFDLTLVIDGIIHPKNTAEWKFSKHAEYLLQHAGSPLTQQQIGDINGLFKNDFDTTVAHAVNGTLALPGVPLNRLQCDVALAYGLRNYGAHNAGTTPSVYNHFGDVEAALFRCLFAAIDYL
jgi:hypothetical protein